MSKFEVSLMDKDSNNLDEYITTAPDIVNCFELLKEKIKATKEATGIIIQAVED